MTDSFVLGIAGGSGSGKTTLIGKILRSKFGSLVSVLPHDAYYLNKSAMPKASRGGPPNWDHPKALDNQLYEQHIKTLLEGKAVDQPLYSFVTHSREDRVQRVEAKPVLLLDGILLFAVPKLRKLMHLRVYIDTPAEERIVRRLLRDTKSVKEGGRGRTVTDVANQFRRTVRPMHDQFVEPSRAYAHLIIPGDGKVDHQPAIELLLARISQVVA